MVIEMMMTLEAVGIGTKLLKDWDIDPDVTLVKRHRGVDTLTFKMTVQDGLAAPAFPADTRIVVRRDVPYDAATGAPTGGDGIVWFVGRVTENPISLGPNDEIHKYVISGPWWEFENITFQQQWYAWDGAIDGDGHATPTFIAKDTTHVIVPWKNNVGVPQTLTFTQQVQEAVNYAINRSGVLIQLGTIDLVRTVAADGFDAYTSSLNELRDISVAEVINTMLKFCVDAVTWWDYSTTVGGIPKPTFHCKLWKRLPEVTMPLGDGTKVSADITPRYDLQRAGVVCRFEKANVADDKTIRVLTEQVWPPGVLAPQVGVLVITIDLQGAKTTYSKTELECLTIDAFSSNAATRLAWWKNKIPWLKTNYIRAIVVDVATRNGLLNLPRELKNGTIPEWLDVDSEDETIKAEIHYEKWSRETGGEKQLDVGLNGASPQVITVDISTTNAESGTFSDIKDNQPGEPEPQNFARFLYESMSILHWSGAVTDTRQDCPFTIGIGQRLNLSGGRGEWTTMKASITTVTETPHMGTTQYEFGPPERLGPMDHLELHRINRRERQRWTNAGSAASGDFGGSAGVDLGSRGPKLNSTSGPVTGGGTLTWGG